MAEYVVYILYSKRYDKKYIGYTSNLVERMRSHNYLGKKGYTVRYRPWIVVHLEYYSRKREAMLRERFLKTGKGRDYGSTIHFRFVWFVRWFNIRIKLSG